MTFEEKVERLSAIEDIKQLKARYCQLCDAGYDPDGIAAMFVEDGVWDGGEQFGCHIGRDAIHGFFSGVSMRFTASSPASPATSSSPPTSCSTRSSRWMATPPTASGG